MLLVCDRIIFFVRICGVLGIGDVICLFWFFFFIVKFSFILKRNLFFIGFYVILSIFFVVFLIFVGNRVWFVLKLLKEYFYFFILKFFFFKKVFYFGCKFFGVFYVVYVFDNVVYVWVFYDCFRCFGKVFFRYFSCFFYCYCGYCVWGLIIII